MSAKKTREGIIKRSIEKDLRPKVTFEKILNKFLLY